MVRLLLARFAAEVEQGNVGQVLVPAFSQVLEPRVSGRAFWAGLSLNAVVVTAYRPIGALGGRDPGSDAVVGHEGAGFAAAHMQLIPHLEVCHVHAFPRDLGGDHLAIGQHQLGLYIAAEVAEAP